MNEIDIRILEVKNGFTIDISYTDDDDNYKSFVLIAHNFMEAMEKVKQEIK